MYSHYLLSGPNRQAKNKCQLSLVGQVKRSQKEVQLGKLMSLLKSYFIPQGNLFDRCRELWLSVHAKPFAFFIGECELVRLSSLPSYVSGKTSVAFVLR